MARSRSGLASLALALLALVMFSVASVRSDVMQATMASLDASPAGDAMPGMTMDGDAAPPATVPARYRHDDAGHNTKTACPYCAAAAHLPLGADGPVARRTSAVSFVRYRPGVARGPRGPPAFEQRARGPPGDPLPA